MKITAIRARTLAAPNKESRAIFDPPAPAALGGTGAFREGSFTLPEPAALTVVEVETDAGITGLGTVGGFNIAAESIISGHLAPLLVGKDPLATEALWDHMYHQTQQYGLRGAAIMAMSGVDLALWDILAKECGQPVYNLIGGKSKPRVPLYMSLLRNNAGLENTVARAAADAEAGFRAMKYFFTMNPAHGPEGMRREVEVVREIRAAIGPDVQFMVDAHIQWDLPYAKRMIDSIAEYDIAWLEEPLSPDDIDGHRRLADYSPIPIAAGEHARTRFDYLDFINAGVHFLQPDINRVGGYTEVLRICALAAYPSPGGLPAPGLAALLPPDHRQDLLPDRRIFPGPLPADREFIRLGSAAQRTRSRRRLHRTIRHAGVRMGAQRGIHPRAPGLVRVTSRADLPNAYIRLGPEKAPI